MTALHLSSARFLMTVRGQLRFGSGEERDYEVGGEVQGFWYN